MAHKWLPVFGQSIDFVLKQQEYAHPTEKVPYFISQALRMVRMNGLTEEAIGRAAASNDAIEGLKRALNAGPINLADDERARDPHVCIAFVKKYLSELPDTLVPRAERARLWMTKNPDELRKFVASLPPANVELLRAVVSLFHDITLNSAVNKMTADQTAKVLGPLLVNFNSLQEYTATSNAAQLLVTQYPEIFAEANDARAKLATSPVVTLRKLYGHKKAILSMCYSAAEKRIWTGDAAGVLCSWDADALKIVGDSIPTGPAAILALIASNGCVIAACVNTMQVYSASTRKKIRDVSTNVCYMTEAAGRIWTGGQGSLVRIFDSASYSVVKEFSFEQGNSVRSMATEGSHVWVASTDRCIRVFRADTYEQIKEFKAHSRAPLSIEPIPDLGQVWTTSDDKSVRVWSSRDQALVGELNIPTAKAYGVVSLGGHVLTYGWDRAFLLADVQSIKIDGQVDTPHTDAISVVLVRQNDRLGLPLLWSASWDQSVCISAVRTTPVPSPAQRVAGKQPVPNAALAASSQSARAPGAKPSGGAAKASSGEKPVWQLSSAEMVINANTPILGKGTFGTVYKAVLRGQPVAVKKFFTQSLDETLLEDFKNEVMIMSALSHPNVLLFMGACFEPGNLIIVTELMPRGNVEELLYRKEGPPPLPMRMKMARDAAQGMTWLHCSRPPFLHLDLKPANLLVDENYVVKVADFGFALIKQTKHDPSSPQPVAKGTPIYAAPEVLLGKTFDEKADVFSFAMVLWEMYTCEYPWANTTSLKDHVRNVCVKNERPPLNEACPQSLREAIQAMWHIVPEKRPSFEDILPRFEAILIESTLLHDVGAVRFWKAYFPEEQGVPFPRFAQALLEYFSLRYPTGVDDVHIKCVGALVSPNNSRVVTLEQFSNVVEWCGPFTEQFVSRVHDLLKLNYFHGDLSAADAQRLMANDKKGSWVLRFSSKPGDFTITVKGDNNVTTNYRLEKVKGGYVFGKTQHPSLADALSVYKKDLGLKTPVGGSKFEPLFAKKTAANDAPQDAYSDPDFK